MSASKEFLAGFACALAALNRLHDEPNMVCDVMDSYGVTAADLKRAGVDPADLREIRRCVAQQRPAGGAG